MKYNDKHVPNSPFRVRAGPPFDASKVKVSGVDESPITDEPAQVLCDCTEAGTAPLTGMETVIGVCKVGIVGKSFVISNFKCFQCGFYSRTAFISKSLFVKSLTTVIVNRL